jgi:hypothetical protein
MSDPASSPAPAPVSPSPPGPPKAATKPAAIEFPVHYKAALGPRRLVTIQAEAKDVLGAEVVYIRNHGSTAFATADPNDCLNFPTWHERAGTSRYEWADRGDGVRLGVLADGAAGMVGGVDPRGF